MIQINRCGYASHHPAGTRITSAGGSPDFLLLLIHVNSFITIFDETFETAPNSLIILDKNTPYTYGSDGEYRDDWIHFDFSETSSFFESLHMPLNIPILLPESNVLSALITFTVNEFYSDDSHSSSNVDHYMHILLQKAAQYVCTDSKGPAANPYAGVLNRIRAAVQNTPSLKWTVEQMAEIAHISPSRFQHLYKAQFGVSCIHDVIDIRIEYACMHLKTTDLSVQTIAELCGYENDVHFIRQFKRYMGIPPGEYRKNIPLKTNDPYDHRF